MGLGMLVDNGIVVVENVYRLMDEEGMSRIQAAKKELVKSPSLSSFNPNNGCSICSTRTLAWNHG